MDPRTTSYLERAGETLAALLELRRRVGDHAGAVDALHRMGLVEQARGRHEPALVHLRAALASASRPRARSAPSSTPRSTASCSSTRRTR